MPAVSLVFPRGKRNTENILIYCVKPVWDASTARPLTPLLVYPGDSSGVIPPLNQLEYRLKLRGEDAEQGDPYQYEILSTVHLDAFAQNLSDSDQLDIQAGPALEALAVPFGKYQGALDFIEGTTEYTHLYSEPDVIDRVNQPWLEVFVVRGNVGTQSV